MAEDQDTSAAREAEDGSTDNVESLKTQLEAMRKAQAGSDRKVAEQTKALEALSKQLEERTQAADNAERTAEEKMAARIAKLEEENREAKRQAEQERRASKIRDEASSRGIPQRDVKLYLASDWSIDDIISDMDEAIAEDTERVNAKATEQLASSYKPGSGAPKQERPAGIPEGLSEEDMEAIKSFEWMT